MQVKCSFCKSPIDSSSTNCEWCGSVDPVDKRLLFTESSERASYVIQENLQIILNEKQIKAFLIEITNINSLHKTSANKGVFGFLLDKLDGSNLEKRKIDLIDNFGTQIDGKGFEMIYQKVQVEHQTLLKTRSQRDSIFNPNNSQDLISDSIMRSWINLLKRHQSVYSKLEIKNDIVELINKY